MNVYRYVCAKGHQIRSYVPVDVCPVCPRGRPCDGVLKRVGPGSRKDAK